MIPTHTESLPHLTTDQMREVDRAMIEDYGIDLVQMMENAGRHLAQLARVRFLGGDVRGASVVVCAGSGGNGGGAITCARRLACWGAAVEVILSNPDGMTPVPARQLRAAEGAGVRVSRVDELADRRTGADLLIDGVIGYSLIGAPTGDAAALIRWLNEHPAGVVSLDVPSGLDSTTGEPFDPAVRATATMTLALPKVGLRTAPARGHVGELYLADISVPPSLYARPPLGIELTTPFSGADLVRLW